VGHTHWRRRALKLVVVTGASLVALAWSDAAFAETHVSGTLSGSPTWTLDGSPYILDNSVTVPVGSTLFINPGVVVKFGGQTTELRVNGTLSAFGAGALPVVFTSIKDDTVGGDSNHDGSTTAPAPGQWYQISFGTGSTTSQMVFTEVRYGGYGTVDWGYGAISVGSGAAVSIQNSYIHHNQRSGVQIYSGSASLFRTTVAQNANGISANMGSVTLANSTVIKNSNDGLWFNLTSTYSGATSTVMDSNVMRNGGDGIEIGVDRTLPLAKWPHGNRNNIFDNASQRQIYLGGYHPVPTYIYDVDWKGNYWGDVYFWYNPSLCNGVTPNALGHLAYTSSHPAPGPGGLVPPPDGPLPWRTYIGGSGNNVAYCAHDRFPVGPSEFSQTYITTAGRLALADTQAAYAPELRYDSYETYRAAGADMITDYYNSTDTNMLQTSAAGDLAAADWSRPLDNLWLGYIGPTYNTSVQAYRTATSNDKIDEVNNYAEAAQAMQSMPQYADRTYAHYVPLDGGGAVMQYWFFYYDNPKTYLGFGAHEGDWEMVQISVDPAGNPLVATYSQHSSHEHCDWIHVPRTPQGHLIVYVAEGSHANYFSNGYHFNAGADDYAGGEIHVTPTPISVSNERWLTWPGHWGGSDSSPDGPAMKGQQWFDPIAWQNGTDGCTEGQTFPSRFGAQSRPVTSAQHLLRKVRPALPRIEARRIGKRVLVTYSFRNGLQGTRSTAPWMLLTAVQSAGRQYAPLTERTILRKGTGQILQKLGLGHGPFKLRIAVLAKDGVRSAPMTVTLR
jgi:hypothetical protein